MKHWKRRLALLLTAALCAAALSGCGQSGDAMDLSVCVGGEPEELDPIYARVIARDPGQWFDTFSVNRGTNDGVSVGMAVVTGDGLVGRVYEAGLNYAKVLTIIDSRSAVSCLIERTRDNGICHGSLYVYDNDEMLRMNYLPDGSEINTGDRVITSGLDGVYPKGLLIGTVRSISRTTGEDDRYVVLTPAVDFAHIEEVLIMSTEEAE